MGKIRVKLEIIPSSKSFVTYEEIHQISHQSLTQREGKVGHRLYPTHPLTYSQNVGKGWDLAGSSWEPRTQSRVPHGWQGHNSLSLHCCLMGSALAEIWSQSLEAKHPLLLLHKWI